MKKLLKIALISGIIMVAGCKKKTTEPEETNDLQEIQNIIATSEFFNALEGFSDWNPMTKSSADTISDYLVFWGRKIDSIDKNVNVQIDGDSAFVTITRNVFGTLHIIATGTDTSFHVEKPLHHVFTRYALFKKHSEGEGRKWKIEKISDGESRSVDSFTVKIDSIKIEIPSQGITQVYKNPLEMRKREEILQISPGDTVIVTYYTNRENLIAVLHPRPFARRILKPLGNGIFQGTYHAPMHPGIYHVAFDVLRWESVMTQSYPFEDAHVWFYVYEVK